MSMIDDFQKLEELLLEALARARAQVKAYQANSDKQDETLGRQVARIGELEARVEQLASELAKLQPSSQPLDDVKRNILVAVAGYADGVSAEEIAAQLGVHLIRAELAMNDLAHRGSS